MNGWVCLNITFFWESYHFRYSQAGWNGIYRTVTLNVRVQTFVVLDVWLTVHHSITLADLQLDAQKSFLFTYNTFIKIPHMFRALPCSSSGGVRRNCICAAFGIITVCKWLSCAPFESFLNRCTRQSPAESDDTRGCKCTFTTWTSWWRAGLMLETCRGV
jgi:hypothetical protein